jgi:hypothetical protein
MQKIIKKWGEGLGIYLDKEDIRILNLKVRDIIDIEIVKEKRKNVRKKEEN